jgi:transcriptional regulator with XRE-family HTH domain
MKVTQNIKDLRKAMGYSQRKLAELSGVPRREISRIENNNNFSTQHVFAIAHALEISLGELAGRGR